MGFVDGGSNIAITTALPPPSFVHCIVSIKYFMDFLYLIFYGCLRLQFLDVVTNPGLRHPVPAVCRILCSNVRGLAGNFSDVTVTSSQYDILLCSEILVSDMRHVSEVLGPVLSTLPCCVGARCLGPMGWLHTFEMVMEHFANPNLSVVILKCWLLGLVVRDRTFMCTVFIATLT